MFRGRWLPWGSTSPEEALGAAFGSLERRVLNVVWEQEQVSVRDVHAALGASLAYTTLMTTLDRLYKKGVLVRRKVGRAYVYAPLASRREIEESVAGNLLEGLLGPGAEAAQPVLSGLVNTVGERDEALLDELERLIRQKRRQLRQRGEP